MGFWRRDNAFCRQNSGDVGVRMDAISGDADVNRLATSQFSGDLQFSEIVKFLCDLAGKVCLLFHSFISFHLT